MDSGLTVARVHAILIAVGSCDDFFDNSVPRSSVGGDNRRIRFLLPSFSKLLNTIAALGLSRGKTKQQRNYCYVTRVSSGTWQSVW
jgi:hypothetical protein